MRVLQLSTVLTLWAGSTSAFYPYIIHKETKDVKMSDEISKGFAFAGKGATKPADGISQMKLSRREISVSDQVRVKSGQSLIYDI